MPYWTENKEALGLRGSSPWVEGWEAFSYVVVDGKAYKYNHYIRNTYYCPNNMTTILVGDFDHEEILNKFKKHLATQTNWL